MAFTKITEYVKNIKDLPNRPSDAGITPDELKAWFDGRTDKEIKELFNALIDELTMKTAAGQIGAEAVSADDASAENIQAKLMYLRAYPDALVKKTMDNFIKSMLLAEQARKIGADKVSSDDVSADNIQAKLAFIKAYAEAVQKNLESALINPRVFPDGSVTSGKLAEGAVTEKKLSDGSVTTAKLADEAITEDKVEKTFLAKLLEGMSEDEIIAIIDKATADNLKAGDFTFSTTDPGAGSAATTKFYAVYEE